MKRVYAYKGQEFEVTRTSPDSVIVSRVCEQHDHPDFIIGKIEGESGWGVGRKESGYSIEGTFAEAVDHCVEVLFDECASITQVDQFFMEHTPTLKERLDALAVFLDDFESPIEFGYWESPEGKLPYFVMSQGAMDFVRTCYEMGWVELQDWPEWMVTPEAAKLRDDPSALEQATSEQLGKLLTVVIRQDRFVEGALEGAFESGLLTGIVRRASVLAIEMSSGEEDDSDELPLPSDFEVDS